MSTPRLTFLYPHLFAPVRVHTTNLTLKPLRPTQTPFQKAGISTTRPRKQETYTQRYGTAAEPQPPPGMPSKPQGEKSLAGVIEREVKGDTRPEQQKTLPPPSKESVKKAAPESSDKDKEQPQFSRDAAIKTTTRDPSVRAAELDASESHPKEQPSPKIISDNNTRIANPLETVLQMGAPATEKPEEHKPPHLQAPPYVHHFDTFTLVKDLQGGGFSEEQSVTIMKAVRGLLAVNLDVAKEGLISKSDVENVNALIMPPIPPSLTTLSSTYIPPHSDPKTKKIPQLTLTLNAGNLPLPRRLLRTPHRNPQHAQIHLDPNPHPTHPPPAHVRHPLPARLAGDVEPEGRPEGHAQRPPHGRPHAEPDARRRDSRAEL